MPAFLIPIFIIFAIVLFSTGGDILKNVWDSISGIRPPLSSTQIPEKKPASAPSTSLRATAGKEAQKAPSLPKTSTTKEAPAPGPAPVAPQTQSTNSPYFQKIRISSVRPTKDDKPALVTISASFSEETPINTTGWKLKSQWLGETIFGKGIEKFHPVFANETMDNILVRRSDTLYVRGEQSPFGRGISFKPNQCFGYLTPYYTNLPGSYSCSQDRPRIQDIRYLKPSCQEYILQKVDYSSCKPPDFNDPTTIGDSECKAYLIGTEGTFTYQGCYEKRSKDSNFLFNRWDIYIERSFGHPLHDAITLLDQTGLVVDTYIY